MKKITFLLLLVALSGCFGKHRPAVTTGLEGKPMPSFNLLLMDSSTQFNTKNIPSGKPIVLFLFSPFCPFCRAQTEEMIKHVNSLSNITFFMISSFDFNATQVYYQRYHLNKYPNITMGHDNEGFAGDYFKADAVPYVAIYGSDKILKQVFIGRVSTDIIKDIAFERLH